MTGPVGTGPLTLLVAPLRRRRVGRPIRRGLRRGSAAGAAAKVNSVCSAADVSERRSSATAAATSVAISLAGARGQRGSSGVGGGDATAPGGASTPTALAKTSSSTPFSCDASHDARNAAAALRLRQQKPASPRIRWSPT